MDKYLGKFTGPIFAITRFVFGFLFMFHGAQKLFGAFGGTVASQPMFQAAGVIELVGGIMIAIGLLGSWAAFIASGEMAFAYFIAHQPRGTWPVENGGELPVLFCFFFLYVAAHGSGIWSVDAALRKK
jgi:putative oxidoreductase